MGDIGINATTSILEHLKEQVAEKYQVPSAMQTASDRTASKKQMDVDSTAYEFENRKIRGAGDRCQWCWEKHFRWKTCRKAEGSGQKGHLAAADTFRAAAGEQLTEWANRAGVDIIGGQDGADPASVVYDAVAAAKGQKCRCTDL